MEIINPHGFIYITTNMIDGKRYIGQKNFRKGWEVYLGSGKHFKRAIKKYGKENFSREIIAIAYSKEELDKLEIEFIKLHNAVESDDYYNLCDGGIGTTGFTHSEETKQKQSEANKGEKNYLYGKHPSEENKRKISEANIKLNNNQVSEIRVKFKTGRYTQTQLGLEYFVTHSTIHRVVNYKGAYVNI